MLDTQFIKSIAPYTETEVKKALNWLLTSEEFVQIIQYFYPQWSKKSIRYKLKQCQSCAHFQVAFIEPLLHDNIQNKMTSFEVVGLDNLSPQDHFLYISNHRDVFLDSGLLQYSLYHRGLPFTEISLGDNLVINKLAEVIAKLNNMFTVLRTGNKSEMLHNARRLSAYLHHVINEKKVSAWIAQGNGRTKNGDDQTFAGLLNMLLLSSDGDYEQSIRELKIMVSTISYEYEPCALAKAKELHTLEQKGAYTKSMYEDIESIMEGIACQKGGVKLVLEPLELSKIDFSASRKQIILALKEQMDTQMHRNYQLWKTNYMAFDLLHQTQQFQDQYTAQDFDDFQDHLNKLSTQTDIQTRIIRMYAKAVENAGL